MEAHNSLQIIQSFVNTPTMEVSPPKTIKMEDITSTTSSQSLLDVPSADSKGSKDSKATKKRKSWGQVLPEPKTNLPPRKRAKTADEKEQRRIERVKRNRLAAHNSRERKRAEVEALQERNNQLEQHMKLMESIIAQYQSKYPDSKIASVPHFEYEFDSVPAQLPPTPTSVSQFITEMPQRPQPPFEMHTPAPFSSPDSLLSTIDSPADTAPSTPGTSLMDGKADRTQQSAVSVGFFAPLNLGGNEDNGKFSANAHFDSGVQLPEITDDGNLDFDFALYPEDSNSFFTDSFDGSVTRDGLFGGDSTGVLEPLDDKIFDLQPGVGALV